MWGISQHKMRAIGHRGCRGPHQENSLQAIQWAYDNGAWAVEVDVWLIDGEPVLIHDRRAHAYVGATGYIKNVALSRLRQVMEVPSLDDALHFVPRNRAINIEIKDPEALDSSIRLIERYCKLGHLRWNQVLFSSFDHRLLVRIREKCPLAYIAPLFSGITLGICQYALDMGAIAINVDVDCIDQDTVQQAHANGLAVYVYTVNCAIDVDTLSAWGVDGIFCDDVAWYQAYRHDS